MSPGKTTKQQPNHDNLKITYKDMKIFCAIHEQLRKAPEGIGALCKAQGVDVEFISGLEHKLGLTTAEKRLVNRHPFTGSTSVGNRVREAFDLALKALQELEDEGLVGREQVRVQATRSVINTAVLEAYKRFDQWQRSQTEHLTEVIVTDGFSRDNKFAVRDGHCHFGVGYKQPEKSLHLEWTKVLETQLVVVCKKEDEGRSWEELVTSNPVLTLPDASVLARDIANLLPKKAKNRAHLITLPGLNYVTEWVKGERGVAFALEHFVPDELGIVPIDENRPKEHVYLYRHEDWEDEYPNVVKRFGECLETAFRELTEKKRVQAKRGRGS